MNAVIRTASRMLPNRVKRVIKASIGRTVIDDHPENTTYFPDLARPSALVHDVFDTIKTMSGWFNIDDCAHFSLVLAIQSQFGVRGDLLEIGCYHGRSTALMAKHLRRGEKLVVCDTFCTGDGDAYPEPPSAAGLIENILRVNPGFDISRVEIHECTSRRLQLPPTAACRFVHIDGGHSEDACLSDLVLCSKHLVPGGVMAVDDYAHYLIPGVTAAVDSFLNRFKEFEVLADLNRHGDLGRKIYLSRSKTTR